MCHDIQMLRDFHANVPWHKRTQIICCFPFTLMLEVRFRGCPSARPGSALVKLSAFVWLCNFAGLQLLVVKIIAVW